MKNKILSALLAVVIAVGLWLYVITVESPGSTETIHDIPVVMVGETVLEEERGLIITSISATNVDLKLSGNRSDLNEVNAGNITLKADLSKIYEPGQHKIEYSISYPGTVASNAFTEESRDPDYITVTVEKRVTATIPVDVRYIGTLDSGFSYDRENAVLDYPEITVTGPSSVVEQIAKARIEVHLAGVRESISKNYRFTLCNAVGEPVDAQLIRVNVEEVHLDLKIRMFKEVALTVTVVDGGGATEETAEYKINPTSIKVSGSEAALKDLKEINIGTIYLSEHAKATQLTFPIPEIEGVTNETGTTEATVDLRFPGLSTKEYAIEDIELINIPEGIKAELITEKLTVIVRGPSADIAKLTVDGIKVTVDLSEPVVGTSTYKGTIVMGPEFATLGAVGSYSVTVTVQE